MTATKLKLTFSALVVVGATTAFIIQHQAQEKLRAENESLQQQNTQLEADIQGLTNRLSNIGDSQILTDKPNYELLKLRGEVGVLRRQADEAEQNLTAALSVQAKFAAIESTNIDAIKYLGLAMRIYAGDHNNQFPSNEIALYKTAQDFDGNTNLLQELPAIEYLNTGAAKFISQNTLEYPNMVMVRERIARQAPDGMWHRAYLFADGSEHIATSYDGNFDAWEKANTYSPPPNQ